MSGIYIHIPFCKQACHYCDFHFSTALHHKTDFLNALLKEIEIRKNYLNQNTPISTIYFGGGTPSLLEKKELDLIFNQLYKFYSIESNPEITLEANPDDLTKHKLAELADTPVNRLSIGVQSFFNEELKWMNRSHDASAAENCIVFAQDAGFNNISIDLIYGSPKLHNENWIANLEKSFSLNISHLSCYSLTVEEKTALAAFIKKDAALALNENQSAEQFAILMQLAAARNYDHYEISNFCREEKFSRHNSNYWKGIPYIGFGPSAHSYNGKSRQWNKANNAVYIKEINQGNIPFEEEILKENQIYNEYIMLSLRTKWGVDIAYISTHFGDSYRTYFLKRIERHITETTVTQMGFIFTLTPKGKFYADRVASDLFYMP